MDGNFGQDQNQYQQDNNGQGMNQYQQNANWQNNGSYQQAPNQNPNGYYNGYPNGGYPNQQMQGNNYNNYAANGYNGPVVVSNAIPQKNGGLAVGSLVCGIISILGFWSLITFILAIVGVVLGIVNNAQDNPNKGMAIAGVILNIIGFLLTIIFIAIITAL